MLMIMITILLLLLLLLLLTNVWPVPVAAGTKTWVCGCLFDGIAGSNPVEGADLSLVSAVCCQVEVSAMGQSFVQESPAMCVCVCVCGGGVLIRCNSNLLQLQ